MAKAQPITIVSQLKPYMSAIGDLCWADPSVGQWLIGYNKAAFKDRTWMLLCLVDANPWTALDMLQVDAQALRLRYECPFTGLEFWSVVPTGIWAKDLDVYHKRVAGGLSGQAFDREWIEHMFAYEYGLMPDMVRVMLGSGFTDYCRPCDGGGKPVELLAPLSNGDVMSVFVWEWYNK